MISFVVVYFFFLLRVFLRAFSFFFFFLLFLFNCAFNLTVDLVLDGLKSLMGDKRPTRTITSSLNEAFKILYMGPLNFQ